MGTTKLESSATAKKGVNYVRNIIESSNSIFHEVHQENDYGNDAFIELVDGTNAQGITLAIQIKSGSSFCTKYTCKIPAKKQHFEYWKSHSLPVLGVVYDPNEKKGYWVDIKKHINCNPEVIEGGPYRIIFKKKELSSFTSDIFEKIIKPIHLNKKISLSIEQASHFLHSKHFDEHKLGLSVLLNNHYDTPIAWEEIFKKLRAFENWNIDESVLYYLADVVEDNPAFSYKNKRIPATLLKKLHMTIHNFSTEDITKVLSIYDEEDQYMFYPLGVSAKKVVSLVKDKEDKLISIIENNNLEEYERDGAAILYAHYLQEYALDPLVKLADRYPELTWLENIVCELESYSDLDISRQQ